MEYRHAVWDFILEHCDIEKSGALFIKFHASNRKDFERRIHSRIKGYHREDVVKKGKKQFVLRQKFLDNKIAKNDAYNERKRKYRKIQNSNFIMKYYYKLIWRM